MLPKVISPSFDHLKLQDSIAKTIHHQDVYIKRGQGINAVRRIFENQKFDSFESEMINQLNDQLHSLNISMKEHDILRFLYSNDFNIDLSLENIKRHQSWLGNRRNLELTLDALKILVLALLILFGQQEGVIYIAGRDRWFRPSIIINAYKLNLNSPEIINDFAEALYYSLFVLRTQMFFPGKVENWIILIETKKASLFNFPFQELIQLTLNLMSLFPSCLEQIYIFNPSKSLLASWQFIEESLSQSILKKIQIIDCDGGDELKKLFKQFHKSQIEAKFGGHMLDIIDYWPPMSTLIHGSTEHEHLALTTFSTNIEDTQRSLNMIKRKSDVFIDQNTQLNLTMKQKPENKIYQPLLSNFRSGVLLTTIQITDIYEEQDSKLRLGHQRPKILKINAAIGDDIVQ